MISVTLIVFISKQFGEEKPKVVVVVRNLDLNYWGIIKAGAEKGFKDFGIDGRVISARDDTTEEQKEMIKNILKEKPDVLILAPINMPNIIPELEKFVESGIPVLFIHADDPWKNKTAYIGTNNLELGKKAGILMASQLQPGDKVAFLGGNQPTFDGERAKGAKASLEAVGIKIAAQKEGLSINTPEVVEKRMETILQEHPDLKGVVATNDFIALSALKVVQEKGLDIPVTGGDGIIEMLKLIEEGTVSSAVAQNPYDMGYLSVETALKVTKGKKVGKTIDSGVDVITKSNARQRIEFYNNALE
jgi:ribose transport system substrate-binding protein